MSDPIKKELGAVYLVSLVICILLHLSQYFSGFIYQNSAALAAMVFIFLPLEVLRKKGVDPAEFGIHRRNLGRHAAWALIAGAVIFPLFLAGHHAWQLVVVKAELKPRTQSYALFPRKLERHPTIKATDRGAFVWKTYSHLYIWWQGERVSTTTITIDADKHPGRLFYLERRGNRLKPTVVKPAQISTHISAKKIQINSRLRRFGLRIDLDKLSRIGWSISSQDVDLSERIFLGAGKQRGKPKQRISRSWWWLIYFVLIQLVLVAFPEELFYRGYIQGRLNQLFPKRYRVLGAEVGLSVLYTSILFALGHFLVDWNPMRLAVFFPSLVFGWLRERTGGIGAAIGFHALSNIISEVSARLYLVQLGS